VAGYRSEAILKRSNKSSFTDTTIYAYRHKNFKSIPSADLELKKGYGYLEMSE